MIFQPITGTDKKTDPHSSTNTPFRSRRFIMIGKVILYTGVALIFAAVLRAVLLLLKFKTIDVWRYYQIPLQSIKKNSIFFPKL